MKERIAVLTINLSELQSFIKACQQGGLKVKEVTAKFQEMDVIKCYIIVNDDSDLFNLGIKFSNEL